MLSCTLVTSKLILSNGDGNPPWGSGLLHLETLLRLFVKIALHRMVCTAIGFTWRFTAFIGSAWNRHGPVR